MNQRNMVMLAYRRVDHLGASLMTMTETCPLYSNTGVLVLNQPLEDLDDAERRRAPSDPRRHLVDITVAAGLEALEAG